MQVRCLVASLYVVSAVLVAAGSVSAADEWFVLGERTIKSADPSVEIFTEL